MGLREECHVEGQDEQNCLVLCILEAVHVSIIEKKFKGIIYSTQDHASTVHQNVTLFTDPLDRFPVNQADTFKVKYDLLGLGI